MSNSFNDLLDKLLEDYYLIDSTPKLIEKLDVLLKEEIEENVAKR